MSVQASVQGMRIAVLGASGFIGRHVEALLLERGGDIVCVSRRGPAEGSQARWVVGDVSDPRVVSDAVSGAEAVIYLASTSLPASANAHIAEEVRKHVEAPVRTAEACRAHRVRSFVFASSGGTIYGPRTSAPLQEDDPTEPVTAYGVSKLAVEAYLRVLRRLKGLHTTSLRISNPYGEHQTASRGQGFVSAAMAAAYGGGPLTIWGDGSVVRDYVHVSDVARALVDAATYDGPETVLNIGSGRGYTLIEIVSAVEEATRRRIDVRFEPERAVDVPINVLDVSKAQAVLHWTPSVDLPSGLERTARWWEGVAQLPAFKQLRP